MRFLVLMAEADHYARWDASTAAEQQEAFDHLAAFAEAVGRRGSVVHGEALARPAEARTLRASVVTEGPYAETTEQLGGFFLVDLPDRDAALELARLLPPAWTVEVRPVVEM